MVNTVAFAVPGDPATPTGGYTYDRRIIAELPDLGWRVDVLNIGEGFPRPTRETRASAAVRLAAVPEGRPIVIDGLAFGVLPDEAEALRQRHALVALVHHPLALETGLSQGASEALRQSERAALATTRHVIASSPTTARLLNAGYGVPSDRLTVVQPGTDRVAQPPRRSGDTLTVLSVGAIVPRKGYDVLIAALASLRDRPWRLVIVGDRTRSPKTAGRLDADIARHGLGGRIEIAGPITAEELASLYSSADLFVLPSRFEGYGMAYAEAIAYGVPVVGTNAGAIPETVPRDAGILVPPDDVDALATALQRLFDDRKERQRLTAGARAASFPSWHEQATLFARVLDGLV